MSVGLPILASNVTGNIDTIENKISGYYYDLGNITSFHIGKRNFRGSKLKQIFQLILLNYKEKVFNLQNEAILY